MKSFSTFVFLAAFSGACQSQVTPVCYGRGECVLSVYLDDSPTTSADECNDICQSIEFCQDWTLLLDFGLCYSFADCAEFDTDCENCYSGTRSCGDLPCAAPGKCEGGRTLATDVFNSANECLSLCQSYDDCLYYTWDSSDSACIVLDNCPDVFTDCETCVYGHVLCEDQGVATTIAVTTSTTTESIATTGVPVTTGEAVSVVVVVRDATDGAPLADAAVSVKGAGAGDSYEGTTDADGEYALPGTLSVGGPVNVTAAKAGYEDYNRYTSVPEGGQISINMSPTVVEGEFRGVMSWGSSPADLDFHDLLFTQTGDVECEVSYENKDCGSVNLDLDNQNGGDFGPETITWTAVDEFTHLVFVYDYTGGATSLYESGAHVTFYGPDNSQIDVDVPTDDTSGQRYWVVACIDGAVGYSSINVLNYLTDSRPDAACQV